MDETGVHRPDGPSAAERDARSRQRRAEVLALPMLPLRVHGYLRAPDYLHAPRVPDAVGVGADSVAMAAWPAADGDGVLVTSHQAGKGPPHAEFQARTSLQVYFVQPLPAGRILLVSARTLDADNAEIWTTEGHCERSAPVGDAIEHVLTTASGVIWVGYFDEALGSSGPAGHGLARFTAELQPDWLYPYRTLPPIDDCYALNVAGDSVYCCAYDSFHLITVHGTRARSHGPVPVRGANRLLADGERAALIGGYGPEYDVITPLRITAEGVATAGPQRRLVRPDGLEVPPTRFTCRGPDLHMITKSGAWYRLSLDDLAAG